MTSGKGAGQLQEGLFAMAECLRVPKTPSGALDLRRLRTVQRVWLSPFMGMAQLLERVQESHPVFIAISEKSQLKACGPVLAPHRTLLVYSVRW